MPLKTNEFNQNVPFFQSYSPYQPPPGTQLAETVDNMISYNLTVKPQPSDIYYNIGAEGTYKPIFVIQNITTNAILDIEIKQNNNTFIINLEPRKFTLNAGQSRSFDFELNKDYLNSLTGNTQILANMEVVVTNRENGLAILTRIDTTSVTSQNIPSTIEVV